MATDTPTRIVYVRWLDAYADLSAPWRAAHELPAFHKEGRFEVEQVGVFVAEDEEYLTLASSFDTKRVNYGSLAKVPIGCIIERREIEAHDLPVAETVA